MSGGLNVAHHATEDHWQTALRKRFPGVVVRENRTLPEDDDILPALDVFLVPDHLEQDYILFCMDGRRTLIDAEHLPDCDLLYHTVSATREHYPAIWAHAQTESRRSGRAQRAKPAGARKSSVKKAARRAQPASH
jgi:hypothetical protein